MAITVLYIVYMYSIFCQEYKIVNMLLKKKNER